MALADNLQSYWKLDGNSNDTLTNGATGQTADSFSETNQDDYGGLGSDNYTLSGQSFTCNVNFKLTSCKFYLSNLNGCTGNIYAKLYSHTGTYGTSSLPGTLLATSDAVDVSTITAAPTFGLVTFTFSGANQYDMTAGYYCIEINYTGGGSGKYIREGYDSSSPGHSGNYSRGTSTAYSGIDLCFYVYGTIGNNGTDTNISYIGTEVDANNHISETTTKITFTGLINNENAFICRDFGTDYFSGNFSQDFSFKITSIDDGGYVYVWGMTNYFENIYSTQVRPDWHISASVTRSGANYYLRLLEFKPSSTVEFDTYNFTVNTEYYCQVERDEGVGTYGTLYLRIYSDSGHTNLLDTLSLTLRAKNDFRYLYAVSSRNQATTETVTGYVDGISALTNNSGKINQGAGFNGSTSKIVGSAVNVPTNATISCWFKSTQSPAGGNYPSQFTFNNGDTVGFGFMTLPTSNYLRLLLRDSDGVDAYVDTSVAYNDGNWHFLVGIKTGSNIEFFVDNVSKGTASDTFTGNFNSATMRMGTYSGTGHYYSGSVDECGYWSRALTSDEVTTLYNSGNGNQYPFGQVISLSENLGTSIESFLGNMDSINSENHTFDEVMSATRAILISISEAVTFTENFIGNMVANVTETISGWVENITVKFPYTKRTKPARGTYTKRTQPSIGTYTKRTKPNL